METASDKLEVLLGRVVQVELTDGSKASGKLTKIKRSPLVIDDGSGEATLDLPHSIVLDYEESFTHSLTGVARIILASAARSKIVSRVPEQTRVEPATQPVKPVKVSKFDPNEFAGFEDQ